MFVAFVSRPWKSCLWTMNHRHSNHFPIQMLQVSLLLSLQGMICPQFSMAWLMGMWIKGPNSHKISTTWATQGALNQKGLPTLSIQQLQMELWVSTVANFHLQVGVLDTLKFELVGESLWSSFKLVAQDGLGSLSLSFIKGYFSSCGFIYGVESLLSDVSIHSLTFSSQRSFLFKTVAVLWK